MEDLSDATEHDAGLVVDVSGFTPKSQPLCPEHLHDLTDDAINEAVKL